MTNRFWAIVLLSMMLILVPSVSMLHAKVEQRPIYICGYAVNFADSTVCLTEIQCIDTAYVESKNGFLMDRNQYSSQLQFYMSKRSGGKNYTCMVLFDKKQTRLQKRMAKVRSHNEKDPAVHLVTIAGSEFQFVGEQYVDTTPVILDEESAEVEGAFSAPTDSSTPKVKENRKSRKAGKNRKGDSR
ncbi:MAG: hypothetical protein ACI4B5_04005 [Bacteroidaceae bacterium]